MDHNNTTIQCDYCGVVVDWYKLCKHTCQKDGLERLGSTQRLEDGILEAYAPKHPKDKVQQLPTAQQAREMVNNGVNNKANQELEHITKLILTAISNNETCVNGDGILIQRTIEKLRELGYKVDSSWQYNESYYNINW